MLIQKIIEKIKHSKIQRAIEKIKQNKIQEIYQEKNKKIIEKIKQNKIEKQNKIKKQNQKALNPISLFKKSSLRFPFLLSKKSSLRFPFSLTKKSSLRFPFLKNEVNYINGSDTLPPPLSAEDEEEMIKKIETREARDTLIEHNLRLVAYIAKKFENTGANIEELISIGTLGLMKAVSTFKADKNIKLATYASRCIENEILMFIRKTSSQKREVSIDEPLSIDWDGNELLLSDVLGSDSDVVSKEMEEDEEKKLLREAVEKLGSRERVIVEMRYGLSGGEELTQKEVADALGISQSYISRLEKKIMERLRKKIEEKI